MTGVHRGRNRRTHKQVESSPLPRTPDVSRCSVPRRQHVYRHVPGTVDVVGNGSPTNLPTSLIPYLQGKLRDLHVLPHPSTPVPVQGTTSSPSPEAQLSRTFVLVGDRDGTTRFREGRRGRLSPRTGTRGVGVPPVYRSRGSNRAVGQRNVVPRPRTRHWGRGRLLLWTGVDSTSLRTIPTPDEDTEGSTRVGISDPGRSRTSWEVEGPRPER